MDSTLKIKIQAQIDDALQKLKAVEAELNGIDPAATKASAGIKKLSMTDIWASFQLAKGAIQSVIATLETFVSSSNQYNISMKGLSETARVFGQDQEQANKYAQALASDGLMSVTQSAQTLKMLMASGFSIEEAMNLAKSMKDVGAFNNTIDNMGQAMVDASKGMKTGSIELIENIGLTQKLSAVMEKAGIDTSKGIDITNDAAQRRALYNTVLAEGAKFEGNAAKLAGESAGAYAQLGNSWEQLKVQIGDTLNNVFVPLVRQLTTVLKAISENQPVAVASITAITGAVVGLGIAITAATGGLNLLIGAVSGIAVGAVAYVAAFSSTTNATHAQKVAAEILQKQLETLNKSMLTMSEEQKRSERDRLNFMLEIRKADGISITKEWMEQRDRYNEAQRLRSFDLDKEREKYDKLSLMRNANLQLITEYDQKIKAISANLNKKPVVEPPKGLSDADKKKFEQEQKEKERQRKSSEKALKQSLETEEKLIKDHEKELSDYADEELKNNKKDDRKAIDDFVANQKKLQKAVQQTSEVEMEASKRRSKFNDQSKKDIEEKEERETQAMQTTLGNTAALFSQLGQKNKAMFEISKALNIANATMDTYAGATKALAAYPPPFGAIAAATVVGMGVANVANIASQSFTPVEDFIYSENAGLIKFRKDDLIIGGTKLNEQLGTGAGGDNSRVERAVKSLESTLKQKQLAVSVDPITGDQVYSQYQKGARNRTERTGL